MNCWNILNRQSAAKSLFFLIRCVQRLSLYKE
nr:MAG TPA: hypothetical protein [Caudoviricetes sp.]